MSQILIHYHLDHHTSPSLSFIRNFFPQNWEICFPISSLHLLNCSIAICMHSTSKLLPDSHVTQLYPSCFLLVFTDSISSNWGHNLFIPPSSVRLVHPFVKQTFQVLHSVIESSLKICIFICWHWGLFFGL